MPTWPVHPAAALVLWAAHLNLPTVLGFPLPPEGAGPGHPALPALFAALVCRPVTLVPFPPQALSADPSLCLDSLPHIPSSHPWLPLPLSPER